MSQTLGHMKYMGIDNVDGKEKENRWVTVERKIGLTAHSGKARKGPSHTTKMTNPPSVSLSGVASPPTSSIEFLILSMICILSCCGHRSISVLDA